MQVLVPRSRVHTTAVVFEEPHRLALRPLAVAEPGPADVVVGVEWTGISTGTERLLLTGQMPPFPGLGYPLVPGYEAVGRIRVAGPESGRAVGQRVFVPGARCFPEVRCLFGGAAAALVVPGARAIPIADGIGADGALLALAATAHHALALPNARPPELIVGHGALGRLLARIAVALHPAHPAPVVWEKAAVRAGGAMGYQVLTPEEDPRKDYQAIIDVSGDDRLLDALIGRLGPGGEVVLAGFYERIGFDFVPAFLREATIRVSAEWQPKDLVAVVEQVNAGRVRLEGIISHHVPAAAASDAYQVAFSDPACVKMILDWQEAA